MEQGDCNWGSVRDGTFGEGEVVSRGSKTWSNSSTNCNLSHRDLTVVELTIRINKHVVTVMYCGDDVGAENTDWYDSALSDKVCGKWNNKTFRFGFEFGHFVSRSLQTILCSFMDVITSGNVYRISYVTSLNFLSETFSFCHLDTFSYHYT